MNPKEWRERYVKRLMQGAELTRTEAEDTFNAGKGEHDYNDDPEDSADEEMSCWTDDG